MFPCEFCKISKNTFFAKHFLTAAFIQCLHRRSDSGYISLTEVIVPLHSATEVTVVTMHTVLRCLFFNNEVSHYKSIVFLKCHFKLRFFSRLYNGFVLTILPDIFVNFGVSSVLFRLEYTCCVISNQFLCKLTLK